MNSDHSAICSHWVKRTVPSKIKGGRWKWQPSLPPHPRSLSLSLSLSLCLWVYLFLSVSLSIPMITVSQTDDINFLILIKPYVESRLMCSLTCSFIFLLWHVENQFQLFNLEHCTSSSYTRPEQSPLYHFSLNIIPLVSHLCFGIRNRLYFLSSFKTAMTSI